MSGRVVFSEALATMCAAAIKLIASIPVDEDGLPTVSRGDSPLGNELDKVFDRVFNDDPSCDKITIIK